MKLFVLEVNDAYYPPVAQAFSTTSPPDSTPTTLNQATFENRGRGGAVKTVDMLMSEAVVAANQERSVIVALISSVSGHRDG